MAHMAYRQSVHNKHNKLFLENIDFILYCVVNWNTPSTNIGDSTVESLSGENVFKNIKHFFLTYKMIET